METFRKEVNEENRSNPVRSASKNPAGYEIRNGKDYALYKEAPIMNIGKVLTAIALMLAFCVNMAVFAAQGNETQPPPPPFNPKMGISGICGDQRNLYIMAAGKIFQYELSSMKLLNTVELPDLPLPPRDHPPIKDLPGKTHAGECPHHPPMPGPPQGLWTGGDHLYAMAGPVVYRYSLPDLKLDMTQELPKPELPPPAAGK